MSSEDDVNQNKFLWTKLEKSGYTKIILINRAVGNNVFNVELINKCFKNIMWNVWNIQMISQSIVALEIICPLGKEVN